MDKYQVAQETYKRLIKRVSSISNEYAYSKNLVIDNANFYLTPKKNWLNKAKYKEYSYGRFVGELDSEGNRQGMGVMLWNNGDIYLGEWFLDKMWDDEEGIKLQNHDNGLYIGGFLNNELNGHVYVHYPPGYCEYYEAVFKGGKVSNMKRERYADGVVRNSNTESGGGWCGCLIVIIIIMVIISTIGR